MSEHWPTPDQPHSSDRPQPSDRPQDPGRPQDGGRPQDADRPQQQGPQGTPEPPRGWPPPSGPDYTRPFPPYRPVPPGGEGSAGAPGAPGGGGPGGQAPPGTSSGKGRGRNAVVAAVLAAGLVGGGIGAGGTYLLGQQNDQPAASSLEQPGPTSKKASSAPAGSVQSVADKVLPSVVSISVLSQRGANGGSGVVLSADGQILTNNHVVEPARQGGQITVQFNDGRRAQAEIVGLDPKSDLAVIKANGVSNPTPIQLGRSGDLAVGQEVVAIGSPIGLTGTVTSGIVSALDRPVRTGDDGPEQTNTVIDAIQTDAAINPGNSGGALVDMNGNLVGINTAIAQVPQPSGGQSGNIGIGFAIPIDEARPIVEQLIEKGSAEHAQIGVGLQDVRSNPAASNAPQGALIAQVTEGSPAAEAGLRPGDVVTKVNDRLTSDADALIAAVRSYRPGDKVTLTYVRDGSEHTVEVTLGSDRGTN